MQIRTGRVSSAPNDLRAPWRSQLLPPSVLEQDDQNEGPGFPAKDTADGGGAGAPRVRSQELRAVRSGVSAVGRWAQDYWCLWATGVAGRLLTERLHQELRVHRHVPADRTHHGCILLNMTNDFLPRPNLRNIARLSNWRDFQSQSFRHGDKPSISSFVTDTTKIMYKPNVSHKRMCK